MSSPANRVAELVADLARVLHALGVRWYVFGAQAAILHGATRLTADVDVTVELGVRPTADLARQLVEGGFDLRVSDVDRFVERTRVLPVVHRSTRIPVDVVLAGPGLEERFLERAEPRTIEGIVVPIASAEDLVAMKILAGRPKDVDDAVAVLRARRDRMDLARVRETLTDLERALDRKDLVSEFERVLGAARRRAGD